jgi:glyoxylase-like metal-dependent hydrolase (beta-lactamase superfamily II)
VLVAGFPAEMFATNCWVVAPGPGQECVVVDPGVGVPDRLDEVLREHRLQPVAVLLTHGHLDHVFSVTPVCGARGIPAYVHGDDAYRLKDPVATLSPELQAALAGVLTWTEPDDVLPLTDGVRLRLAGLDVTVDHAPGHTEGSVLFRLPGSADDPPLCLSGDVLFHGSIGRTDLSGGDDAAMQRSLRTKILPLPDETVVLPGHGDHTTIGAERATNPYLRAVAPSEDDT